MGILAELASQVGKWKRKGAISEQIYPMKNQQNGKPTISALNIHLAASAVKEKKGNPQNDNRGTINWPRRRRKTIPPIDADQFRMSSH